jgi:hypothetical protein
MLDILQRCRPRVGGASEGQQCNDILLHRFLLDCWFVHKLDTAWHDGLIHGLTTSTYTKDLRYQYMPGRKDNLDNQKAS